MTKYWNSRRIQRVKERENRALGKVVAKEKALRERQRSYTLGDRGKNADLMFDALGLPLRRKMVARLKRDGAMSLSKLAKPFGITLPSSLAHIHILERVGIVKTHKRGRIRICVYNPKVFKELAAWLMS